MPTIYQTLGRLQYEQELHDDANHKDVWGPGRLFALRHYGLHFSKYGGRIAREDEPKPLEKTLADCLLVCLSAANSCHQNLGEIRPFETHGSTDREAFYRLADLQGRFAEAYLRYEKDPAAATSLREANWGLIGWILQEAARHKIDVIGLIPAQRAFLRGRKASSRALASSVAPDPEIGGGLEDGSAR